VLIGCVVTLIAAAVETAPAVDERKESSWSSLDGDHDAIEDS